MNIAMHVVQEQQNRSGSPGNCQTNVCCMVCEKRRCNLSGRKVQTFSALGTDNWLVDSLCNVCLTNAKALPPPLHGMM